MRGLLLLCLAIAPTAAPATMPAESPTDEDAAALSLPATPQSSDAGSKSWTLTTEGALTSADLRSGGTVQTERLTFDGRYDTTLAPGLRLVVADLLDLEWQHVFDAGLEINTFKEGYLSWQPASDVVLDAGRINERQGVAFGYNPTDFFREDAVRTVDSLDPNSLRQNRLGTVMVRGEALWNSGAFSATFAPRVEAQRDAGPFSADFGATNHNNRWMLTTSQRFWGDLTPQILLFGGDSGSPQLGANLTYVMGSATVLYVEASGGHQRSLWSQAGDAPNDAEFRARAATGFTYSAANKLSVTLEYEYNGAALDRGAWDFVRQTDLPAYARYRNFASAQQDLATQHNAFIYASWQDVGLRHLDLATFIRFDMVDHSALPWAEMRYHWTHLDAAIRWQNYTGSRSSDFGASPQGRTWQAVLDYYL